MATTGRRSATHDENKVRRSERASVDIYFEEDFDLDEGLEQDAYYEDECSDDDDDDILQEIDDADRLRGS